MYPRWRLAVQNIYSIKITQKANIWEEMEVLVENLECSIPQSVAKAIIKTILKCIAFMTPDSL